MKQGSFGAAAAADATAAAAASAADAAVAEKDRVFGEPTTPKAPAVRHVPPQAPSITAATLAPPPRWRPRPITTGFKVFDRTKAAAAVAAAAATAAIGGGESDFLSPSSTPSTTAFFQVLGTANELLRRLSHAV